MDWNKISAELSRKLDPAHVVKPTGQYGPKGDYLEGWHVINEANRIFGFDGWSYTINLTRDALTEGKDAKGNPQWQAAYTCICTLTVGEVTRQDVGFGSGFAKAIGDAIEGATKEAVTDAIKRALRTFGNPFGLALYDKTRENVGPSATPAEVETAVSMLEQATSLDALSGIFAGYWRDMRHVAEHPAVMGAKDKRKAELQRKDAA